MKLQRIFFLGAGPVKLQRIFFRLETDSVKLQEFFFGRLGETHGVKLVLFQKSEKLS